MNYIYPGVNKIQNLLYSQLNEVKHLSNLDKRNQPRFD